MDPNTAVPGERSAMLRVFAGGVVISFSPVLFKVSGAGPTAGSFWRTLIGGLFLFCWALARRERPFALVRAKGALALVGLCAALFFLDLEFWHRSIPYVGPGLATIIANFEAVLLAVFGVLFFHEKVTLRLVASVLFALCGLWLLVGVDLSALPPGVALGVAWGLGSALWYAFYILGVRRSQGRLGKLPAVTNMAWISLCTAFFVGIAGAARGADFSMGGAAGVAALAAYGIGPQALGWVLISSALPGLRASVAGLIILIQPTLAFVWDILLFHRPAGPASILGALLALLAIYLGAGGGPKAVRSRKE
ncbi:MAG: DMT family transporter [Thermodesulfobacteriota bacterium]